MTNRLRQQLESNQLSGPAIQSYIMDKIQPGGFKVRPRSRPWASTGAHCARMEAFSNKTPEFWDSFRTSSTLIMKMGEAIEEWLMGHFEKKNILVGNDIRMPQLTFQAPSDNKPLTIDIGGKTDPIIYMDHLDKILLLEVKSTGTLSSTDYTVVTKADKKAGFVDLEGRTFDSKKGLPVRGNPKYNSQAVTYGALLGLPIAVVYIARTVATWPSPLDMRVDYLPESDPAWKRGVTMMAYTALCLREGVTPPKPADFNKTSCQYCHFQPYCWEDEAFPDWGLPEVSAEQNKHLRKLAGEYYNIIMDSRPERGIQFRKDHWD